MKCLLCPKYTGPGQVIEAIHPADLELFGPDELFDVHAECARQRRQDLANPERYPWYCTACDQVFFGDAISPQKCSCCGRATNGGFGLPFAAYPDTNRVNIEEQTFIPYEGESEWVQSANKILQGEVLIGKELKAFVDAGLCLNKRQAITLTRKVIRKGAKEQTKEK